VDFSGCGFSSPRSGCWAASGSERRIGTGSKPIGFTEVADTNDEKYQVEAPPDTPLDEIVLFVQKSAGSKRLRKECEKDWRGPWCDVFTSFKMPRQYFTWQYLIASIGGPLFLLMVGSALYWAFSGFRRAAES
jgi:hypothetical protein